MRTAFLTAAALVALSSLAVAQTQIDVTTEATPEAKPINPNAVVDPTMPKVRTNAPGGKLHYDVPCRVSSAGTCITPEPPPYRPRPSPKP
jgi:hypothetical protein